MQQGALAASVVGGKEMRLRKMVFAFTGCTGPSVGGTIGGGGFEPYIRYAPPTQSLVGRGHGVCMHLCISMVPRLSV